MANANTLLATMKPSLGRCGSQATPRKNDEIPLRKCLRRAKVSPRSLFSRLPIGVPKLPPNRWRQWIAPSAISEGSSFSPKRRSRVLPTPSCGRSALCQVVASSRLSEPCEFSHYLVWKAWSRRFASRSDALAYLPAAGGILCISARNSSRWSREAGLWLRRSQVS